MIDLWMRHIAWRVARRAPMAARRIFTVIALLVLGAGPASAQLKAPGEVRWFVDATTNVIVNSTSFASVPIPAGHTAVLKSVVDAACSCASRGRGLWDGTTYTLPASLKPQTTDAGRLKAAARVLYQRLIGLSEGLAGVASYWPREDVSLGHDLMAYAHRGVRGVVMSPSWTVAQKLTFMKQMALGPSDVTNPAEYFEVIEMDEDIPDAIHENGQAGDLGEPGYRAEGGARRLDCTRGRYRPVERRRNRPKPYGSRDRRSNRLHRRRVDSIASFSDRDRTPNTEGTRNHEQRTACDDPRRGQRKRHL